jgi:hypothetical protein
VEEFCIARNPFEMASHASQWPHTKMIPKKNYENITKDGGE